MNTKPRIFVTRRILDSGIKLLHDHGFEVEIFNFDRPIDRTTLHFEAEKSDGLITMLNDSIDCELINRNRHLKVIANYAVGFNNIDLEACQKAQITVTNTPDVLTDATAEIAMGLMIAASRRFHESEKLFRENQFTGFHPTKLLGQSLTNKTLGIIGLGRIGERFATMAHNSFNMKIIYTSKKSIHDKFQRVSLTELLNQSDVISIHSSLNAETKNLIGPNEFKLMKKNAILINTARGDIVDQEAMIWALANQMIFGAGLDVTTPEPLPINHPLLNLANCFILPHIGSANIETREEMSLLCAKNIIDVFKGVKPQSLVI